MSYKESRSDPRWCRGSAGRIGEFGVIGAEQADETYYDDRSSGDEEDGDFGQSAVGRIKFSKKQLYGRQTELLQLIDLWDTHCQHHHDSTTTDTTTTSSSCSQDADGSSTIPCTAFIAGYSGCGKSTLVEEFVKRLLRKQKLQLVQKRQSNNKEQQQPAQQDNDKENAPPPPSQEEETLPGILFLSAKYSQQQLGKGVPFGAFGSLFDHLDDDTQKELQRVLHNAQNAMGQEDARILGRIFPGLAGLMGDLMLPSGASSVASNISGTTGSNSAGFLLHRSNHHQSTEYQHSSSQHRQQSPHHHHQSQNNQNSNNNNYLTDESENNKSQVSNSTQNTNNNNNNMPYQRSSSQYQRSSMKKVDKERLQFSLQYFFRLLGANQDRPLILFLDDLQWCDQQSFQFLNKLLCDPKLPFLFFIGAYRSNEVTDENHPLNKLMKDIEQKRNPQSTTTDNHDNNNNNNEHEQTIIPSMLHLQLKELTIHHVGQFIADSLHHDIHHVEPLTKAIFAKTLGNPLFTRQALEQLVRKNVLYYDKMMFEWAWNLTSQEELQDLISDDIVEMVKSKIAHVPREIQQVLVVAACTTRSGGTFDVETLLEIILVALPEAITTTDKIATPATIEEEEDNYLVETKKAELIHLLDQAVMEGLLLQSSSQSSSTNNTGMEFCFAHDRIEEAARRFMNDMCHDNKHNEECVMAKIGEALFARSNSPHGEDWMYFAAAQHLNAVDIAATAATNDLSQEELTQQRLQLAELNHRVAQLSLELMSFDASIDYCQHGIENMLATCSSSSGEKDDNASIWDTQYECILSLYTIGAEAAYGVGNVELASTYCEEILKHKPRSIIDFLPAYKVKLDMLNGQGMDKKEDAFRIAFCVLEKMGLKFPKGKHMQRMTAWSTLKQVRLRYIPTEESINDMPHVSDPVLIEWFDILTTAGSFAYQCNNIPLYVLVCCEALRWMSKNGLTDGSAGAIASFANLLMHVYGDFSTSVELAELAIQITNRIKRKFKEPRALNTANAFVLGWVKPLRTCLPYHARAHESGLASGNIEGASVARLWTSFSMFYGGMPLAQLETYCRTGIPQQRKMELFFDANQIAIVWQAALNLMGGSDNNIVLAGKAMDEKTEPFCNMPFTMVGAMWKRYLCVFFGEWEEGSKNALEAGDMCEKMIAGMMYGMEPLIRGILLWVMLRKSHKTKEASKYKKPAHRLLKQMKDLVSKGCVNVAGPTRLMEAERLAMAGKKRKTRAAFEDAISICQKGEFHQYAGLTHERYAEFLTELGDAEESKLHIARAIECYSKWGARKKVDQLRQSRNRDNGEEREAAR